jgi:hypothetical protein
MESAEIIASLLTRNRHLKQSHYGPWNRHSNMSDSWRVESIASKNSRLTRESDSKNRFMFDAWNRQTHYASAGPEIGSANWVTVKREIIFETESRLTNGTDKTKQGHRWPKESLVKTVSTLTRNRHLKQSHCRPWNRHWNMSGSWRMEWTASQKSRARRETESKNIFMFDAWNRQTHNASADPEIGSENWVTVEREIIFETDSRMTDGIDSAS